MFSQPLDFDTALLKEEKAEILLLDASDDQNNDYHPKADKWRENFNQLRTKFPTHPPNKIPDLIHASYRIEIPLGLTNKQTNTWTWRYLWGVPMQNLRGTVDDGIEYIYVLTNKAYPNLVKIGMTTKNPARRLEQVNGTGTVHRWELYFHIGVKPSTAYNIEQSVHKYFTIQRYHAKNLNDREMFYITPNQAIEKILEVSAIFQTGVPKYY